jgi:hypothetical protein
VRGFRGSRAAANFNSRSERHYENKSRRESYLKLVEERSQPKSQKELPTWLRGLEDHSKPKAPKSEDAVHFKPVLPKQEARPVQVASNVIPIAQARKKPVAKKKAPVRKAVAKRKTK